MASNAKRHLSIRPSSFSVLLPSFPPLPRPARSLLRDIFRIRLFGACTHLSTGRQFFLVPSQRSEPLLQPSGERAEPSAVATKAVGPASKDDPPIRYAHEAKKRILGLELAEERILRTVDEEGRGQVGFLQSLLVQSPSEKSSIEGIDHPAGRGMGRNRIQRVRPGWYRQPARRTPSGTGRPGCRLPRTPSPQSPPVCNHRQRHAAGDSVPPGPRRAHPPLGCRA